MIVRVCDHHYNEIGRVLDIENIPVLSMQSLLPCDICGNDSEWCIDGEYYFAYVITLYFDKTMKGDPDPDKPIVGILSGYRKG